MTEMFPDQKAASFPFGWWGHYVPNQLPTVDGFAMSDPHFFID